MRNQAAVTERRTGKKARPGSEAETPSFSRAQLLALLVGLLQIVFASIPFQLRIVAKESLGRIPFMGWHLHRAGHGTYTPS